MAYGGFFVMMRRKKNITLFYAFVLLVISVEHTTVQSVESIGRPRIFS